MSVAVGDEGRLRAERDEPRSRDQDHPAGDRGGGLPASRSRWDARTAPRASSIATTWRPRPTAPANDRHPGELGRTPSRNGMNDDWDGWKTLTDWAAACSGGRRPLRHQHADPAGRHRQAHRQLDPDQHDDIGTLDKPSPRFSMEARGAAAPPLGRDRGLHHRRDIAVGTNAGQMVVGPHGQVSACASRKESRRRGLVPGPLRLLQPALRP